MKDSTRTLCRQLQDNPDVEGNQKKIKGDKYELVHYLELLNAEMRELSYAQFKADIRAGLEAQGEFERLRNEEKNLNIEIKRLSEESKRAQDEFAKEANENNQEILNLKKQVNETKTEKELYVQYKARETEGKLQCQRRQYDKEKEKLMERIRVLEDQLRTENLVSERIRKFVQAKTELLHRKADDQERLREKRVEQLEKEKDEIHKKREEDETNIHKMHNLINQEVEDKGKRDREERERQEELARRRQEKMDMEDAARYIQRKWKWY